MARLTIRAVSACVLALPAWLFAACTSVSSPGGVGASSGATSGGTSGGNGTCPCDVGNSGLHFTIGCGDSQCVELNGAARGWHCTAQGAVEDPSVCTNPPPPQPGVDAGPCGHSCIPPETCGGGGVATFCGCTPKTCAELGNVCGEVDDGCKAHITCPGCEGGLFCNTGGHCAVPASNVIVIGNYQGGTFAINVDQDLPNIGIGIVSYDAMHVTIAGAHAANVVAVVHAGAQKGTTVTGVSPDKFVDYELPQASADGGPGDVIADDIGGLPASIHPNPAEVASYFQRIMGGGTLAFHKCQYDAYSSTIVVSGGGTCK